MVFSVLIPFSLVDSSQRLHLKNRTFIQKIKIKILIALKASVSYMSSQLNNTERV
jgi:hypothetical protein